MRLVPVPMIAAVAVAVAAAAQEDDLEADRVTNKRFPFYGEVPR
jgi:hypothetical protein